MNTEPPRISVILPAFNVADHIAAAVASMKAQHFTDFEAIVIDDGSTDQTAAFAQAAIGSDPRFRLIRQTNRGLSGARNAGLDLARAPVIGFLDTDDRLDPMFLHLLHDDLQTSGADWVACGIAFCTPDGTRHPHSAIHGKPDLPDLTEATTVPLSDWADIIPHFPSAWNKLYRREFIGALRFDEGLWFEDHPFFHRLAAKSPALRYIPRALYLYTLDRDGQITRADTDRVFEQVSVLELCARIMRESGKTGAEAGLARLATRLCLERLDVIRTPERRARFTAEAAGFFARHGLTPDWRWDPFLNALQAAALGGQAPVTLRLPAGTAPATQTAPMLPDPASPLAWVFHLAEAGQPQTAGALVLDLPAPLPLDHVALARTAHALLQDGLEAAVLPLHRGSTPEGTELAAADLCDRLLPAAFEAPQPPHALLVRTAFASRTDWADPALRLAEQTLRLIEAGARVRVGPPLGLANAAGIPAPPPLTPAPSLHDSLAAIDAWQPRPTAPPLPQGWDRRLALRAASAQVRVMQREPSRFRRRLRLLAPLLRLWWIGRQRGWIGRTGQIDADTPRVVRRIFRAPLSG